MEGRERIGSCNCHARPGAAGCAGYGNLNSGPELSYPPSLGSILLFFEAAEFSARLCQVERFVLFEHIDQNWFYLLPSSKPVKGVTPSMTITKRIQVTTEVLIWL